MTHFHSLTPYLSITANLPDSIRYVLRHAIDRYADAGMGKEGWKVRQKKELNYVLNYLNSKA